MSFPIEVWGLMFSFLPLNDVIEVSALCKDFYCETKKKKLLKNCLIQEDCIEMKELYMSIALVKFYVYPTNYLLT